MFWYMFREWFDLSFSSIGYFSRATWDLWREETWRPYDWAKFYRWTSL